LRVAIDWINVGPQDQLDLFIASDNAGTPDLLTPVGSFIQSPGTPPGSWNGDVTFAAPLVPFTLSESTSYWLVARTEDTSSTYQWFVGTTTDPLSQIGSAYRFNLDGTAPAALANGTPALELEVTAIVPEPAGLTLLMLVGAFGLTGRRRRAA